MQDTHQATSSPTRDVEPENRLPELSRSAAVAPIQSVDDPRYAKAIGNPLRARLMAIFMEQEASPAELARSLRMTLPAVSYHVRVLRDLGLLTRVRQTPRRGAVESHYRANPLPRPTPDSWASTSVTDKHSISTAQLQIVATRTRAAVAAGGFDGPHSTIEQRTAPLDGLGRRALSIETSRYLARVDEITADAAERLARADQPASVDTGVVLLCFDTTTLFERATPNRPSDAS
jgi:DNA-binding transcriptional ArsR family regulator